MATTSPENSPTSCRSPPSRGNWSPTRASHTSRLPIARSVSTVSASSSASSTLSFAPAARDGECRAGRRRGPQARAERFHHLGRERLPVVDLAGIRLGSICRAAALPSEQAARAATSVRILSNSSSSSVCVSMAPHHRDQFAASNRRCAASNFSRGRALHRHSRRILGSPGAGTIIVS